MRMNNFLLLPIIIPFFFGMILMFGQKNLTYQRSFSLLGIGLALLSALSLLLTVKEDGIQKVTFGNWPVPYGITMVSDMVSALLVTTTLLIALFVVWYGFGSITKERERFFYYPGIKKRSRSFVIEPKPYQTTNSAISNVVVTSNADTISDTIVIP